MTLFRTTGLVSALCFFGFVSWLSYDSLHEAYGSGPPYYGRTVNMDKWQSPIPGLLMLDGLALLMGADKATSRLTLTTSALVGSVLFHINMTSSMPPIGYLTFGDRLMMINYIGLVLVLMVNVKVLALSEAGATTIAGSILDKAKYWFIGLFALIHVVHAWFMS
mgnify:CR=1 FL=1